MSHESHEWTSRYVNKSGFHIRIDPFMNEVKLKLRDNDMNVWASTMQTVGEEDLLADAQK